MKCINQIIVLDHSWSLIYRLIEFVLPWNGHFNDSNIKAKYRYNSYMYKANAKPYISLVVDINVF